MDHKCYICEAPTNLICSGCVKRFYCGGVCQLDDFFDHALICEGVCADDYEQICFVFGGRKTFKRGVTTNIDNRLQSIRNYFEVTTVRTVKAQREHDIAKAKRRQARERGEQVKMKQSIRNLKGNNTKLRRRAVRLIDSVIKGWNNFKRAENLKAKKRGGRSKRFSKGKVRKKRSYIRKI